MTPYYEHGGITIYHGDCREALPTLAPESLDVVLTDPPYSSGARRDSDRQVRGSMLRSMEDADWFSHDAMTNWGMQWFLRSVLTAMRPVLSRGAHVYVFTDWRMMPTVYGMVEASGYRCNHGLVWDKEAIGMGSYWRNQHEHIVFASNGMPREMRDKGMGTVLRCPAVKSERRIHPCEKPLPLLSRILTACPDGVVFDPFCGSGPVLRAARDAGRKAIGCDIEERWCEETAKRLSQEVLPLAAPPRAPTQEPLP